MLDWKALETGIAEEAEKAILGWLAEHPDQHPYACAFHEIYSETEGLIRFPRLGINSREHQKFEDGTADEAWKWNPADWDWQDLFPTSSQLDDLESELTNEACRSTEAHWIKTHKRFYSVLVRVTKTLYRIFAKHPQATDDFVVYIDDDQGDIELIQRCLPPRLFRKHFAWIVDGENELKNLSEEERLARYLEAPSSYTEEILAYGEKAIGPLIEKLNDDRNGWVAAGLLAGLNAKSPEVISALRRFAQSNQDFASLGVTSLYLLGDTEHLFRLLNNDAMQERVIDGLVTGMMRASEHNPPVPLNYRHIERLLAMDSESITRLTEKEMLFRNSITIRRTDVDEAIRAARLPNTNIRRQAVFGMGSKSLGKAAGKKILPVLAEKLSDPEPSVRRAALLSLSYWKAAAAPYHEQMKRLQKDPDRDVRDCAYLVFDRYYTGDFR